VIPHAPGLAGRDDDSPQDRSWGVSLLFAVPGPEQPAPLDGDWLADLRLDQLISQVTSGRDSYQLAQLLRSRLRPADQIRFRQEVCRDFEGPEVGDVWRTFGHQLAVTRSCLARSDRMRHKWERGLWLLEAALQYVQAVEQLSAALHATKFSSAGLRAVRDYLRTYQESSEFSDLAREGREVAAELGAIHYTVKVTGNRVAVGRFLGEPDLSEEVTEAFRRFQQDASAGREFDLIRPEWLDPVGLRILDRVARLFPEPFAHLERFWARALQFRNPVIVELDREAQFYLAYLEFLAPLREAGLPVCYAEVVEVGAPVGAESTYDLVLARKLVGLGQPVVVNDFSLTGDERILVVSGPNQGGKTTFAVTVGQVFHLAALGLPVAGASARIHVCDAVLTHFGRTEELGDLQGRLEADLAALAGIFSRATDRSIVILNETFGSASLQDARSLGRRTLERLVAIGVRGVYVTFIDELAEMGPAMVSLVSMVDPEDPAERTFKVLRRPPDGLAYALAIARKYGLTHDQLLERLRT
jgi:DNA mismatch repair protein MutS